MKYHSKDHALAQKILDYSVGLKEGEKIMIQLSGLEGIGLMRALIEETRKRNAQPFFRIQDSEVMRILAEMGDKEFWQQQTDIEQLPLMKQMDAFVGVRATQNIYEQANVTKEQNKAFADYYLKPVHLEERVKNTRWTVMRYPSPAFAMNAKMPTEDFETFYYDACLLDYSKLKKALNPLEERLRKADEVHLKGKGTDIKLSVKNQEWVPCVGERNIPDGEIFSSPVIDSVNGEITYAPSVYQGKPFEYVWLKVKDGVVEDFDSSNNDALKDILDTDEGARRFGEFAIGVNPIIGEPMYDILFDEKIYGSIHLTLGQAYDLAPNGNESSIHWDLVCIGSDLILDGEKIREGRKFIADDLKPLNPENLLDQ